MYRFVRSNDKRYSENSKDSIAALIAENNQDEQEAIKNYEVLLSCLNDVGASKEQIATIEEIISDEKNHSMRLNQLLLDFDGVEPNKD